MAINSNQAKPGSYYKSSWGALFYACAKGFMALSWNQDDTECLEGRIYLWIAGGLTEIPKPKFSIKLDQIQITTY